MWPSALVCIWRHWQALRERDSFRTENRLKMGGESGPRSVNQELHTQPAQGLCGGLCGATEWGPGLSGWRLSGQDTNGYVQGCQLSIPGRDPAGEVTSATADPKRTRNTATRHTPSSNSVTASWGSLDWRVFIQKDVLQLCLDWPGILLQETLEGEVFQMFQVAQHGCLWSFTRRAPKVIQAI